MPETLMDGLRLAFTMLKSKIREAVTEGGIPEYLEKLLTMILKGAYDTLSLVQDSYEFYEPLVNDLREKNEELVSSCEVLRRKNDALNKNYE